MKTANQWTAARGDHAELRQELAARGRQVQALRDEKEKLWGLLEVRTRQLEAADRQIDEERRRARTALAQSEELFAKVFEYSPDMITIQSAGDGVYLNVNPVFLETFGFALQEVIGRTRSELGITGVNDEMWRDIRKELLEKGRLDAREYTLRTKQGRMLTALSSVVRMEIGGQSCLVSMSKDITALKQYEKEMARLDRLNLLGEMAGSIAHEIRNPLTTIRGFLQLMQEKDTGGENRGYYGVMIEELDRANAIISDYLSLAPDKAAPRRPGYLNSIIRVLYPMILADANMRELQVRLDLGDPPQLNLSEKEMRQMILNLARNGLDAMQPGGTLTISTGVRAGRAVLTVRDEGPGLDPAVLDRLGTPFLTTKEGGTGLGLPVCYSIAARHEARITVDTGPGGTAFIVRFGAPAKPNKTS